MLSIPLIRCDDKVFNGIFKQKNMENQVYEYQGIIKKGIINKIIDGLHNNSQLLQLGSKVEPFPLNTICGDQVFDGVNTQENIDGHVFNGIIKEEIIDETDNHNDSQLIQKGTRTEEKGNTIDTEIKIKKDFIDDQEFEGTVFDEDHSFKFTTDMTFNSLKENPFNDFRDKISTASNLTVHTNTDDEIKMFKCGICGLKFSKGLDLSRHIRAHLKEMPFICEDCNITSAGETVLTRHNKIHAREQKYTCDICSLKLSKASDLTRHKRIHHVEKPYKCDTCNQAFFQEYNLKIHKRTHSGIRPHICDICNTGFSKNSHLTRHKRTHTGEKPFICEFCDQTFAQQYNLTTHKRTHTGEKPFNCDMCDFASSDASNLRKHIRRSHKGKKALSL